MKVSWSILSQWSKGNHDEALLAINGVQQEENVYMQYGKKIHKAISDKKMKLIPEIKDTAIFENIIPEESKWQNYFRADIDDWLEMSMVADVVDPIEGLVCDWKTGYQKSVEHNKLQIYIYAYILKRIRQPIKINTAMPPDVQEDHQGAIYCDDYTVYKITDDKLELAENYIITNASEIYNILYPTS